MWDDDIDVSIRCISVFFSFCFIWIYQFLWLNCLEILTTWFFFFQSGFPYSIRILLESTIRNCDDFHITGQDVKKILDWKNNTLKQIEISRY
jgi:hypothetical protein